MAEKGGKKNKNKKQKKRKIVSLGLFWSRHVDVLFIISCLFSLPLPLSLSFFFLFVLLLVSRRIKPFLEFQLNFHDNIKISSSSKLSNSRVKLIQQQQQTHRHHHLPSISATYFIVYLTTQLPGLWSLLSLMVMFCLVFCHTRRCNNSRISKHDLISRRFFFFVFFSLFLNSSSKLHGSNDDNCNELLNISLCTCNSNIPLLQTVFLFSCRCCAPQLKILLL